MKISIDGENRQIIGKWEKESTENENCYVKLEMMMIKLKFLVELNIEWVKCNECVCLYSLHIVDECLHKIIGSVA